MSQRLILPINDLEITAGFKNAVYRKSWGWIHYGVDCVSGKGNRNVYACGDGEVIAAGMDGTTATGAASRLGNVAVVIYRDVLCNDGVVRDLACRMYHLDSLKVKAGGKVTKDTVIGLYGNTGANTSGAHLHIEFDADVHYPCHAKGVKGGGKIIRAGTVDSLVSPAAVWFVDGNQTIQGRKYASGTLAYLPADAIAPKLSAGDMVSRAVYDALEGKYTALVEGMKELLKKHAG